MFIDGNSTRDAIHVSIMPVIAGSNLRIGEKIKIKFGTKNTAVSATGTDFIGVVDPFLTQYIHEGDLFWMLITPGTTSQVRHEWTHPEIDRKLDGMNQNEKWLREFAAKWNFDYDNMIKEAILDNGIVIAEGIDLHSADELGAGEEQLFWYHIEQLKNIKIDEEHRNNFEWGCTC